jgi:hypothetical protein
MPGSLFPWGKWWRAKHCGPSEYQAFRYLISCFWYRGFRPSTKRVHILGPIKTRNLSEPVEKCADCERFQSLASELISLRIEITEGIEPIRRRVTLQRLLLRHIGCRSVSLPPSDRNNVLTGLDHLLKHKQRQKNCNMKPGIQRVKQQLVG